MTTLAQISETQAQKATTANENFDALAYAGLFGRRAAGISGLTWAYYGGILYVAGVATAIADGTVALTLNLTNYVEATTAGVVSANTVGFTAGRMPLYTVVCGATTISSYADQRARNLVGDFTVKGNMTVGGTLAVTGAGTFSSTVDVAGNFSVATNKFTVASASGNTLVAGTLGVTGAITATTATFTSSGAGVDSVNWTNSGASNKTGHLYSDATYAGICDVVNGGAALDAVLLKPATHEVTLWANGAIQASVVGTVSATRYITITGSNGGNPAVDTSAGSLNLAATSQAVTLGAASGVARLTTVDVNGQITFAGDPAVGSGSSYVIVTGSGNGNAGAMILNSTIMLFKNSGAEIGRFTSGGYFKASNSGTYNNASAAYHELRQDAANFIGVFVNANAAPVGFYVNHLTDSNGVANQFVQFVGNATTRAEIRSNGGLANFSANNVNLSSITVKRDRRRYTEAELDAFAVALERVDYGVWKYIDQTHDDFNHGPTAEGVREAFAGVKGAEWAVPSIVDFFDQDKELLGLTPDLEQIAIATLIHSCKKMRGELAALKKTIH